MTNHSLLLALFLVSMSLNLIDALLTKIALPRGHPERNPFVRKLIEKLGLDKTMIVKSLLPVPFLVIFVIIGWYVSTIYLTAIISLIIIVVFYSYVVLHGCITLLKASKREITQGT